MEPHFTATPEEIKNCYKLKEVKVNLQKYEHY